MIDMKSIKLLGHKSTILDFFVILAVIISAVTLNLIAAAGVGIAMAILLFLREQIRSSVVRRRFFGNQTFSKRKRISSEMTILENTGKKTIIFEIQGSLFFGTTDQLFTELEPFFSRCKYIIIDMRRVLSLDYTAANMLRQIHTRVKENEGYLVLSSLPLSLPTGQNIKSYLIELGFSEDEMNLRFFPELNAGLEWVEDELLRESILKAGNKIEKLEIGGFEFFQNASPRAIETFRQLMKSQHFKPGEPIFTYHDKSSEIYFIRKGSIKIILPLHNEMVYHIATFTRGDFFGDMAFLDKSVRSADAIAEDEVDLFILSRDEFDLTLQNFPEIAGIFFEKLALALAQRLRLTNIELMALEEN